MTASRSDSSSPRVASHSDADSAALQLRKVSYTLKAQGRSKPGRAVLRDVTLSLSAGETVAIMGPSGAGKSTLLSISMGLIQATAGSVSIAGTTLDGLSRSRLARIRSRHLGIVFQAGELLDELSPLDNVALPALMAGPDRSGAYQRAVSLMSLMDLRVENTPTDRLSGGERQRVAVARALINNPDIILADEPTGSLDSATRDQVADHLFSLPTRTGCALFVVTHDVAIAGRAHQVYTLDEGRLHERG